MKSCTIGACPSVHELDDGDLLIVGRVATDEEIAASGARVGDLEVANVIKRDLLADIGMVESE